MELGFFETVANLTEDSRCRSVRAAIQIRQHAIAKAENPQQARADVSNEQQVPRASIVDPLEFIPTTSGLRKALTLEVIRELLGCRCEHLCGPQWSAFSAEDDLVLARTIWLQLQETEWKLTTVAIFVLSGTLFALRYFHRSTFTSLDEFIFELQDETRRHSSDREGHRGRLREELFSKFRFEDDTWNRDILVFLTDIFVESIKAKRWLVRIPHFEVSPDLQIFEVDTRKVNLPFVGERPVVQAVDNREYLRFRLAREYASENLQAMPLLFRKVHSYLNTDLGLPWSRKAHEEVKMLRIINRLDSDNIAKMLFTFEEQDRYTSRLSIVFQHHEHNLGNILFHGRRDLADAFGNAGAVVVGDAGVLRHGLWKGMQEVIGAVLKLHEFDHPDLPRAEGEAMYAGHFDIKPANILIDLQEGRSARLLLTDFDRAVIHRHPHEQPSGRPGGPATHDYAPPEMQMQPNNGAAPMLRRCYDIWSLGCVLLEVLVHLSSDGNGAKSFWSERLSEGSSSQEQDAAFWTRDMFGGFRLRRTVDTHLSMLEQSPHPGTSMTAACIRRMLSIGCEDRPRLSECIRQFRNVSAPSRNDWIPTDARGMLTTRLSQMITFVTPPNASEETSCNIYLWHRGSSSQDLKMLMAVERAGPDHRNDKRKLKNAYFVPVAFFAETPFRRTQLRCAFRRLFEGAVFRFQELGDYLNFFTLFTSQRLLNCSIDVRFTTCEVVWTKGILQRRTAHKWTTGSVQIWSTYEESKYRSQFEGTAQGINYGAVARSGGDAPTSQSGLSDSEPTRMPSLGMVRSRDGHRPDPRFSRFKLALFVHHSESIAEEQSAGPICVVFQMDTENIVLESQEDAPKNIRFKGSKSHSSFPVAIYWPSIAVRAISVQGTEEKLYPGIPCSPEQVNDDIRHAKDGLRLSSLELKFANRAERDSIMAEIARLNIMQS